MTDMTRKRFLGLSAVSATGLALASAARAAPQARAANGRLLIKGADLLSMDPKIGQAYGMDLLVEGDKIAAIGKDLKVDGAEVIDARGMILMPGMVDGHRHVWEGIHLGLVVKNQRGYSARYQDSKMKLMVAFTPEDNYLANYVGGLTALSTGVTSLIDYAHIQHTPEKADAAAKGLKDSGVAGWYCWQTSHSPSYGPGATLPLAQAEAERGGAPEAWRYEHAAKMRDRYFSDSSAPLKFGLALSANVKSLEAQRREITKCRQLGAGKILQHYHTPVNPPPGGWRGIVDLDAAGLMGPDLHFDHANNLTDEDLKILARSGASTCSTVMGEFPYAVPPSHWRARAAGVAASIGIDVPIALNNDYFETVRAAFWNMYRTPEGAAAAADYEPENVLEYATTLGARALRQDYAGSLTVGKRADMVLLRTDRFGFAPHGSLAARVVNFGAWADVDSVWVAGKAKKRKGEMVGVDMARLRQQQIDAQLRAEEVASTITFT